MTEDTCYRGREVFMVGAIPKCIEHNLALQLIRVDLSQDKIVTDVYGCPHLGCRTERLSRQARRTFELGKREVVNGSHGTVDTL